MFNLRNWIQWIKSDPISDNELTIAFNVAVLYTITYEMKNSLVQSKKHIKDKKLLARIDKAIKDYNTFEKYGASLD